MRKSLLIILLVAGSFGVDGSALCFAAEAAKPKAGVSTEKPQQRSQLSERKMHRMQKAGSDARRPRKPEANQAQGRMERAPNPSQRSMRQKLKEAKQNQAPATGNTESR